MADTKLGGVYYEVDIELEKALEKAAKLDNTLDGMGNSAVKAGKQINIAERSMSSLSRVATALTAALSVQQVAAYADAWANVNNKLANAVRPGEQLASVTERVFNITQQTRSSLDATASLYARLERATRQYGTSADDLAKLTTIINQGFVVSGATAQEAENAIIQLSQGLASGALRGEEFNSVNEQGNRLIVALADSMGVTIGQMRNMAAQGKLTTDAVVNGLLSQGASIGKEFARTTATIGQSLEVAGNNITRFIGSSATVKTAVAVFNSAVITLSENLELVSTAILAVSAVMGSRYVGALAAATAGQITNAAAAYRAATAQGAMSAAAAGARSMLALIGGPAGAATLAAAAIFYFYQKAQQAKQESIDFADKLDGVISKMKEMNQTQISAEIAKAQQSIIDQKDAISDLRDELTALEQKKTFIEQAAGIRGAAAVSEDYEQVQRDIAIQAGRVDAAENKLSQTVSKTGLLRAQLNGNLAQGIDLLKRDGDQAGVASGLMNQFGNALSFASRAKERFNSTSLSVSRPKDIQDYLDNQQEQIDLQSEFNERKRAQLKAEMDIRNLAIKVGGTDSDQIERDVKLARERAGVTFDQQKAEDNRRKAQRQSEQQDKRSASSAESVSQKLESLRQQSELSADSTTEMSRAQAVLQAQLSLGKGATKEQIALAGKYRGEAWDTAAAVKAQAAAMKLIPEQAENTRYKQDVADLKTALEQKTITQQQHDAAAEQMEKQHQVNLARIRATQNAGITPLQEAQGAIDPVQALANENAKKLALIQEFETAKGQITLNGLALMNAANTQYEQQRIEAQWEIYRNQSAANSLLADAVDSLQGGATNAITGLLNGTQSLSEAFANIGSTILNSVVSGLVEMGLQYVKNMLMGQVAASAALGATATQATAAAGMWGPAAVSASIATMGTASTVGTTAYSTALMASKGLAVAGAREHGGPVLANSMYRVGEGGKPEIFKASNGSQYMIPGDNGSVISNRDIGNGGGAGGVSLEVNFNITTTNGIDAATQKQMVQQMEIVALKVAREQSTRDGGFLQKRIKK
ncbi:tape measure protein [Pantoea stewartii]|uniref:tape measure protein n=1 Tax=Pantoea stewartii TaxID=66269 RepID=UPI0023FA424B|nr:tape measure protein [Pantoea stewartii]MDF7784137.1 tape measure protein [Pantoea stewartii]